MSVNINKTSEVPQRLVGVQDSCLHHSLLWQSQEYYEGLLGGTLLPRPALYILENPSPGATWAWKWQPQRQCSVTFHFVDCGSSYSGLKFCHQYLFENKAFLQRWPFPSQHLRLLKNHLFIFSRFKKWVNFVTHPTPLPPIHKYTASSRTLLVIYPGRNL